MRDDDYKYSSPKKAKDSVKEAIIKNEYNLEDVVKLYTGDSVYGEITSIKVCKSLSGIRSYYYTIRINANNSVEVAESTIICKMIPVNF